MKQTNYIEKNKKKSRFTKGKIAIFGLLSLVIVTIGLVFIFNFRTNKSSPGVVKGKNYTILDSNSATFNYRLIDNNGTYDLSANGFSSTKYAQIISVSTQTPAGADGYNIKFPESIRDNGIDYQVKQINCTVDSNGAKITDSHSYFSSFSYNAALNTAGASFVKNIKRIEVPNRVEYIEVGSFNGLGYVEEMKLPFVGTKRGNHNFDGNLGADGYKSAFLSIFGYGSVLMGREVSSLNTLGFYSFDYKTTYINQTQGNTVIQSPTITLGYQGNTNGFDGAGTTLWVTDNSTSSDATYLYMPYYLSSVEITDEVYVAPRAFYNMTVLKDVTISYNNDPNFTNKFTDALTMGEYVFYQCYNLHTAILPSNCGTIGTGCFANCTRLGGAAVELNGNPINDSNGNQIKGKLILPEGLNEISESLFANCASLSEVTLPKGITAIRSKAFLDCINLSVIKSSSVDASNNPGVITLPQTVTSIGTQAFRNCKAFTNFSVPVNVTSIGSMAFNGCSKLASITLPFIGSKAGNSNSKEALFGYIFGEYSELADGTNDGALSSAYQVVQNETGDPNESDTTKKHSFFIPETLINVTILNETVVAPGAFMNCSKIQNIRIMSSQAAGTKDTVTTIAEGAMYGCSSLKEVSLPFVGASDSVSNGQLGYIFGKNLFSNTEQVKIINEPNKYWYIPSGLKTVTLNHQTVLTTYSFYNTFMVENVIISKATQEAQRNVFYGCKNLTTLEIPFVGKQRGIDVGSSNSNKNNYGYYSDGNDYWWEDLAVRNSMVWLFAPMGSYGQEVDGYYEHCYISGSWRYSSYSASIPNSLSTITITNDSAIPSYAFRAFTKLNTIEIQDTIVSDNKGLVLIDGGCMTGCSSLNTLVVPFIGADYNNNSQNNYTHTIGWYFGTTAYSNSYVASQSGYVYYIPKSLTRINITGLISSVPAYAFANMTSLSSVAIPNATITTIGDYSFYCDNNLTTINWPKAQFNNVANYAFANCSSLGEMDNFIPATVSTIGNYSFMGTSITGISTVLNAKITSIGNGAFKSCYQITEFDFSKYTALSSVGNYLFEDCGRLVSVKNIKFLTNYMFKDCISLRGVNLNEYYTLPTSKKQIPEGLFYGCYNLLSNGVAGGLEFDNSSSTIDTIGAYAFKGCSSLTTFTLPESIIQIGNGAFQDCTHLEKLRINRNCVSMIAGTNKKTNVDDLKNGIFYGCNKDFYLEVYYQESQWPTNWGYNWNCYFPVMVIGQNTDDMFKYSYDEDLKGYVIVGFNTEDYVFVTTLSSGLKQYLLSDIVIFPSTYNGLPVRGIISGAFDGYGDNYFEKVNSFVLGENYVEMGAGVLTFEASHTVYIYSQMTVAQATKYATAATASGNFVPETLGAQANANAITNYYGTSYGKEDVYIANGIVFYKEAWRFVGTTPTILMSALDFKLEDDSYTYNMGDAIEPRIIEIGSNENCIKYVDPTMVRENQKDIIYDRFYNYDSSTHQYSRIPSFDNVIVRYSNNVNVGTASITFTSNTGFLYGSAVKTFTITRYELMLFHEANESDNIENEFGYGYRAYSDVFLDYYYNLEGISDYKDAILKVKYNGLGWSNDQWTVSGQAPNLPTGYVLKGKLKTESNDVGQYWSDKKNGNGGVSGLGFVWEGGYHVYNTKGQEVTNNFVPVITLFVEITPYDFIDSDIVWDGEWNAATSRYEYKYNGLELTPKPYIYDEAYGKMDAKFIVEVTPTNNTVAIDPGTIGTMTIVSYSKNFAYNGQAGTTFTANFEIVKGEVTITISSQYTLDEDHNYYRYNGGFSSWIDTPPTFTMEINGLGPNSVLNGELITTSTSTNLEKGTYSSDSNNLSRKGDFNWDTNIYSTGYYIESSHRLTNDADPSLGFMDETQKYNVTLNATCEIKYATIDYNLSINEYLPTDNPNGTVSYNQEIISIDDSLQVFEKNFSHDDIGAIDPLYIKYGIDGYEHNLGAIFYNKFTNNPTVTITENSSHTSGSTYIFKEIPGTGEIDLTLKIEKTNYETVTKNIKLVLTKGLFKFKSLDKEYDREPVNVLNALLRRPSDLDSNVVKEFKFYDKDHNQELASAPSAIGSYYVKVKMTGSQYFEDFDERIDFNITPRSLIIQVDDPISSKEYDGQPWSYVSGANGTGDTSSTRPSLNLLSGDSLFGSFKSISSAVKLYKASTTGDFYVDGLWRVSNDALGDQTGNYVVVFKGEFEILPKQFKYKLNVDWSDNNQDASGTYVFTYDQAYHYATITVSDPTSNYHIYYSEQNPENGAVEVDWSTQPFFYSQPNSGTEYYTTYIKLVADNYETKYDSVVIKINGKDVEIICDTADRTFAYDGFEHSINVTTNPYYADVYYSLLADAPDNISNIDFDSITNWTTIPPVGIDAGIYHIIVKASALNYNTSYKYLPMVIDSNLGSQMTMTITPDNVTYDRQMHGFKISNLGSGINIQDLTIRVAMDDGNKNWLTYNLSEIVVGSANYQVDLFTKAGTYDIYVEILKHGYRPIKKNITVNINPLSLDLNCDFYQGQYDGEYHSGILSSSSADRLVMTGSLETNDLSYQYAQVVNGIEKMIPLKVEYGTVQGNQIVYSPVIARYKNVTGASIPLYIRVSGDNFEEKIFSGTILIEKATNIQPNYTDEIEIEYLARPVTYNDLGVTTFHDGQKTIKYRDVIIAGDGTKSPGNYRTAPQDLGWYYVEIDYADTSNCEGTSIEFYFHIVPRVLTVEYTEEYEYTSETIVPQYTVTTGTTDVVTYSIASFDGAGNADTWHIIPGTYYFKLNDDYNNPNYVLSASDRGLIEYRIINRKVLISFDAERDYKADVFELNVDYTSSNANTNSDSGFSVTALLSNDTLKAKIKTRYSSVGTYTYRITYVYNAASGHWELHPSYTPKLEAFTLENLELFDTNTNAPELYYDVVFDVKLVISYPELDVDAPEEQKFVFDGFNKNAKVAITSSYPGIITWKFWTGDVTEEEATDISSTNINFRNVGTYTLNYVISASNYKEKRGKVRVIIDQASISTDIDSFSGIYDAEKHRTTYTIHTSPLYLTDSEKPKLYYFKKSILNNVLGMSLNDLYDFFDSDTPENNALFALYDSKRKNPDSNGDYMIDAGDYYAVLYNPSRIDSNIGKVLQIKEIRLEQRTLYFKTTLTDPWKRFKIYDESKFEMPNGVWFVNNVFSSTYDESANSKNNLANAGLIPGHVIKDISLANYTFTTSSADAKGDFDGENNGDPYEMEGDFEFVFFEINANNNSVVENYRPAFTELDDGSYPIQITIKRAELKDFYVQDSEVEYNGHNILPKYTTKSDGQVETLYIKTDSDYNEIDGSILTDQTDVGYYRVYIHIAQGKNYRAWAGSDPTTDRDIYINGKWYKIAKVHCIPKNVNVQWDETSVVYTGKDIYAKPYITDVFGNRIDFQYELFDSKRISVGYNIPMLNAGRYFVSALPTSTVNANNYILNYDSIQFNVTKRIINIKYITNETWLKTNWSKTFTENDTENIIGFKDSFPGYNLELTLKTKAAKDGTYREATSFDINAKVTDPSGNFKYDSGINIFDGQTYYVADNFEFTIGDGDVEVTLISKDLKVSAADEDTKFDNQYHSPKVDVISHASGYDIQYKWGYYDDATDSLVDPVGYENTAWSAIKPQFIVVGTYYVGYQVSIAGEDGNESLEVGHVIIRIRQADAYLTVSNLNRTYTGTTFDTSTIGISGGFNGDFNSSGIETSGNRYKLLRFYFKTSGAPDSDFSETLPINAGRYVIKITSDSDNNPNYLQNYTTLDSIQNMFEFEITPAVLRLDYNVDLKVKDETNITYDSNPGSSDFRSIETTAQFNQNFLIGNNTVNNTIQLSGLLGADRFEYHIYSASGQKLSRMTYLYSNAVATGNGVDNSWLFYNNDLFGMEWKTTNGTSDNSYNYRIILQFKLHAHYPEMTVREIPDVMVDYTGSPISFATSFNKQYSTNVINYVDDPSSQYCVIHYGKKNSTSNLDYTLDDYEQTAPGVYTVYFMIYADNAQDSSGNLVHFENYYGSAKFTINPKSRVDDGLTVSSNLLNKIYDGIAYDENTWNSIKNNNGVQFGETLPNQWSISYFVAQEQIQGSGDWKISGKELSSVTNAGDYIYRLKIPAQGNYAETVIENHFKIDRRKYHISSNNGSPYQVMYSGVYWNYDLVSALNDGSSDFSVQRQTGNGDEGLLDGIYNHRLITALLITNNSIVGIYTQAGTDKGIINIRPEFHVIRDANNVDVTNNYDFIFDFELEITRGTITLGTNIPSDGIFNYDENNGVRFEAWIVTPTGYSKGSNIEYAEYDFATGTYGSWTTSTNLKTEAGTYQYKVRATKVANFNDLLDQVYTFEIKKVRNSLSIDSLDKEYDGNPVNPVFHTYDFNGTVSAALSAGKDVEVKYYENNNGVRGGEILGPTPTNAGTYWVTIKYGDTANFMGIQEEKQFTITPRELVVSGYDTDLTYNAEEQAPNFTILTKTGNNSFNSNNYEIFYYSQNDLVSPLSSKTKNVGDYRLVIKLKGSGASSAENNYSFGEGTKEFYINYRINKCVVIFSASMNYKYDGNIPVIGLSYIQTLASNPLPIGVILNSAIKAKSPDAKLYAINCSYTDVAFTNNFEWNNTPSSVPLLVKNSIAENLDNYDIRLDLNLNVAYDTVPYVVSKYEGIYDGDYHTITFTFSGDDAAEIRYSAKATNDISEYSTTIPKFKNYTSNPIHIYVAVKSTTYTNGEWKFLGLDQAASDYDEFTVKIDKADTRITPPNIDLNKIYDGKVTPNPTNIDYLSYGGDNLDSKLTYTYYVKQGNQYAECNSILQNRTNVGEYYLIISLEFDSGDNYNNTATDPIYFAIKPRDLVIKIPNKVKTYDGNAWSALLASSASEQGRLLDATFEKVPGIEESGLVNGQAFRGTILTKSVNSGHYYGGIVGSTLTDLVWKSGYCFYVEGDTNSIILSNNYNISIETTITIDKADLDIEFFDVTHIYTGQEYFITHTWYNYPIVSGITQSADYDNYIQYSKDPLGHGAPPSSWSNVPIGCSFGSLTIYIKIELPNYNIFQDTRTITITSIPSKIIVTDWGSFKANPEDMIYNGSQYTFNDIQMTSSIAGDTRVPYIRYYELLDDGATYQELLDSNGKPYAPVNAGKYAITLCLDADTNNGYDKYESLKQPFEIRKRSAKVYWASEKWIKDSVTGIVTHRNNYTGSVNLPLGRVYGILNDAQGHLEIIPLVVTPAQGYNCINVGVQKAIAQIQAGIGPGIVNGLSQANYDQNYVLINNECDFEIIKSTDIGGGSNSNPTFPDGGDHPNSGDGNDDNNPTKPDNKNNPDNPDNNSKFEGIRFELKQYDPTAQTANTPFKYSVNLKLYFTVTYLYSDSTTKVYYYEVEPISLSTAANTKFVIKTIYDSTWQTFDTNPSCQFDFILKEIVKTPEFEVDAVLKDNQNYAWNTNGDTADCKIMVQLDPLEITDYVNDIKLTNPTSSSLLLAKNADGSAAKTEYDQTSADQKTIVTIRGGLVGSQTDIVLDYSSGAFDIFYGNNMRPTTSNPTENAYYVVKSKASYPISFEFGDYSTYKSVMESNASNPDYMNQNKMPTTTPAFNPAFTFEIKTPEPTYLQLTNSSTVKFVSYEQDFSLNTLTYTYDVSNDDRYTALASKTVAERKNSIYKLSHLPQRKTVSDLLTNNFVNNLKHIVVCDSNGNVIFDGANGTDLSTASTDYIGTGSYISLYDSDDSVSRLLIDCVEIVVVGDLDGNGIIETADKTIAKDFAKKFTKLTEPEINAVKYIAGLTGTKAKIETADATNIGAKSKDTHDQLPDYEYYLDNILYNQNYSFSS